MVTAVPHGTNTNLHLDPGDLLLKYFSLNCECEKHAKRHANHILMDQTNFTFKKTKRRRGVVAHFFGGSSPRAAYQKGLEMGRMVVTVFTFLIVCFQTRKVNKPIIIKRKWIARRDPATSGEWKNKFYFALGANNGTPNIQ